MTTTVADVSGWLERFAPSKLAESWDNVGLLWGDPAVEVHRVMTCLTVTPESAAEAIQERASLIVSHHPVLFRATKRIRADLAETGHLWRLAVAGISIASLTRRSTIPGTGSTISCVGGSACSMSHHCVRRPEGDGAKSPVPPDTFKIVVFTPETDREAVMSGAFEAGAGQIGAYRECSFAIPGEGTFFGTEDSSPTIGQRGRRESVAEIRLELICPAERLAAVMASIRARHSYEEPAIDVYPLHQIRPAHETAGSAGAGRIGRFVEPRGLGEFAAFVGRSLGRIAVQMVGDPKRPVSRVAVACGAGDDFLKDAASAGADVLFTGEARFHRGVEAEALGIGLVTAGHYATERLGVEELARRIAVDFPGLTVWPSRSERDPFRLVAVSPSDGPVVAAKVSIPKG